MSKELESLSKLLIYDPDTGTLLWEKPTASWMSAGQTAGTLDNNGYRRIGYKYKMHQAHRVAWFIHHGRHPSKYIDHINGIRSDNRIANLREVDATGNARNATIRVDNKTGKKGVSLRPCGSYHAHITVGGKMKHLGAFDNPIDAHRAYVDASIKEHGKYGRHK